MPSKLDYKLIFKFSVLHETQNIIAKRGEKRPSQSLLVYRL